MELFNKIQKYAVRPALFEKGNKKLWEDPHISEGMLNAHLSPDNDMATRKHAFLDQSVDWICSVAPPVEYPRLLDLGCGPGLYSKRFWGKGYEVTGVDISDRSIGYAEGQSQQEGSNINYIISNYLEMDEVEAYDVAILIYCDLGALSDAERRIVLKNAHRALRTGGKFIFDVFTPNQYIGRGEERSWTIYEKGGFFKKEPHICLHSHLIYDGSVRLDQYLIIDEADNVEFINVWDKYFTIEQLTAEIESAGFKLSGCYSDVTGKHYGETTETIAVVVEK